MRNILTIAFCVFCTAPAFAQDDDLAQGIMGAIFQHVGQEMAKGTPFEAPVDEISAEEISSKWRPSNAPTLLYNVHKNMAMIQEIYRVTPDGAIPDLFLEQSKLIGNITVDMLKGHNPDLDVKAIKAQAVKDGTEFATQRISAYNAQLGYERALDAIQQLAQDGHGQNICNYDNLTSIVGTMRECNN